ncbi:MAG: murein endopeptidase [Proteobacteria bacterium]|nr:murein endopeptidase [Pseudomonadota bacterium]
MQAKTHTLLLHRFCSRLGLIAALLLALGANAQPNNWSEIKTPSSGPASAIGSPGNGCLAGAETLPEEGNGYVNIRRHRNRYYGHPELLRLIEDLGKTLGKSDALLMIGDLSQPRGGPMSSSHRSHQNGLDVDIWLPLATSAQAAQQAFPEGNNPPSLVSTDGTQIVSGWGKAQRLLLKTLAEDIRVDRLFINPAIKRTLCESEKENRNWLHKLRPWFGHDAHVHVRMKCPTSDKDCEAQAPLPAGNGCGSELAWWFSDEAKKPSKPTRPPKPPAIPPAACKALLHDH